MGIKDQFGWLLIYLSASTIIFYTLGYRAGKRDGHKQGRSVGIRIGERRAIERVSNCLRALPPVHIATTAKPSSATLILRHRLGLLAISAYLSQRSLPYR
jgi:hypothetical protein